MPIPFPVRILVADDHEIVRRGLRLLMTRETDLEVVSEAADGAEAVERAIADDIHLAILDVSMPRMTGLQAVRELARRPTHYEPVTRVAVLRCHPRFAVGESQSASPGSVVVWRVRAQASAEPPSPITPDGMCQ